MRVYLLKEEDFVRLLLSVDRDPQHGLTGGSSRVFSTDEAIALKEAHRFYNYQLKTWIASVKQ